MKQLIKQKLFTLSFYRRRAIDRTGKYQPILGKLYLVSVICVGLLITGCSPKPVFVEGVSDDGTYVAGDIIKVKVEFSGPVLVTGSPQLKLALDGKDVIADFSRQTIKGIVFQYEVQPGDFAEDLDYTGAGAIEKNGATINGFIGTGADLRLPSPGKLNSLSYLSDIAIDGFGGALAGARIRSEALGSGGFYITGEDNNDRLGMSVSHLGDINGDNIDDFAATSVFNDNQGANSGMVYIIYGQAVDDIDSFNVVDLNSEQGFKIFRFDDCCNRLGSSVGSAGDVNNDGINDIIVGAYWDDITRTDGGAAYVIYGEAGTGRESVNLAALDNDQLGFTIYSTSNRVDHLGAEVAGVGDVNNDGVDDIAIAAPRNDTTRGDAGAVYIIYGRTNMASIDVHTLSNSHGFTIYGEDTNDRIGTAGNARDLNDNEASDSIAALGDINGDNIDDFAVGAWYAREEGAAGDSGSVYVVFGRAGIRADLEVSQLRQSNSHGFVIIGEEAGARLGSVGAAGDFNNDGINDVLVGSVLADPPGRTNGGKAYVIWGTNSATASSLELASLSNHEGLVLFGEDTFDRFGGSVEGVGDVNQDGISDIVIGAIENDNDLSGPNDSNAGSAYIVFGSADYVGTLDMLDLGDNGAIVYGSHDAAFLGFEVSAAGDVNNDGISDVLISEPNNNDDGGDSGKVLVIYGQEE